MSRLALLEWLQTHAQLVQPEALAVERAMEKEDLFYIDDLRDVRYHGLFQQVCQKLNATACSNIAHALERERKHSRDESILSHWPDKLRVAFTSL